MLEEILFTLYVDGYEKHPFAIELYFEVYFAVLVIQAIDKSKRIANYMTCQQEFDFPSCN